MRSSDPDFPDDLARRRAQARFASARRWAAKEDRRMNRNRLIVFVIVVVVGLVAWVIGARR